MRRGLSDGLLESILFAVPPSLRAFVVFAALSQTRCGAKDEGEPDASPAIDDVFLEGGATRGALRSMVSLAAQDWEWSAGVPQRPKDGAELPIDVPFTFVWTTDSTHEDENAANEQPLTGVAFLLRFSTPTQSRAARVFTTLYEYTPPDDVWATLAAHGEDITLHVDAADFEADRVVGEGPFSGLGVTFTIMAGGAK